MSVKAALYLKRSSVETSPLGPSPSLSRILYLPTESESTYLLRVRGRVRGRVEGEG